MLERLIRGLSLLLTALLAGLTFAHLMEMPNKLQLPAEVWLPVQQNLYQGWGAFGAITEPLAIILTALAAFLVRRRRLPFVLTSLATLLIVAQLASWFAYVQPVNLLVADWTLANLPADWPAARLQWEYGHAAGAVLLLIALILLIWAAFSERPANN